MVKNKINKIILEDKTVCDFLTQIAGPLAPNIIDFFKNDSEYTPEILSKKLNEKITNVRFTLNSLHYRGIACYKRKKIDNKFCEFNWTIKHKKILEIVIEQQIEKYQELDKVIGEKKDRDYFACPKKCIEIPFEISAAYNFKCPNCNSNLELIDIKKMVANIKRKKTKIKKNVEKLNEMLQLVGDKDSDYVCESM